MKKIYLSLASILACGIVAPTVFGSITSSGGYENLYASKLTPSLGGFQLKPRASLWGVVGNYDLVKGQALFPLYGNSYQALYGLVEGSGTVNKKGWFMGGGLGYRKIVNDMILGGYAILDYESSPNKKTFLVANPGLEVMGEEWDIVANLYVPFRKNKTLYNTMDWAEKLGDDSYVKHTQHQGFDRHMSRQDFEEAATGADLKFGHTIPSFEAAKIYLGGYYFSTKDMGRIYGGLTKLAYTFNKHVALEFTDSYDNYNHNKALLGLKLTFGGYTQQEKSDFGLSSRLLDNVEHGYMNLVVPVKSAIGTPVVVDATDQIRYDNLWFFKPAALSATNDATIQDGTYEHPFIGINASNFSYTLANQNIGKITPPMLYFAPGQYNFDTFAPYHEFQLPTGWGMFGRSADYKLAATGDQRPFFTGHLYLKGTSASVLGGKNTIDSVIFDDDLPPHIGIDRTDATVYLENVSDVKFNNVKVIAQIVPAGIEMENSTLNLYNTEVRSAFAPAGSTANYWNDGIQMRKGSTLNLMGGNVIHATSLPQIGSINWGVTGIGVEDQSIINFSQGDNKVESVATAISDVARTDGITLYGGTVNFIGGQNTVLSSNNSNRTSWVMANGIATNSGNSTTAKSYINFNGGVNYVHAETGNYLHTGGIVAAILLYRGSTDISFTNGINTLTADSSSNLPPSGIGNITESANNNINFSGGNNSINVKNASTTTAHPAYGIALDPNITTIRVNNAPITNPATQLPPFIKISRSDGYADEGYRILYGTQTVNWTAPWSAADPITKLSSNAQKKPGDDNNSFLDW